MGVTMQRRPGELEISMPVKRPLFTLAFATFWLVGWAIGEATAIGVLLAGTATGGNFPLGLRLAAWTVGGIFVGGLWLLMVFGREVLVLRRDVLVLRRQLWGLARVREYDRRRMSKFRLQRKTRSWLDNNMRWFWKGPIAFNCGLETIRVGNGVNDKEAGAIVEALNK